MSHDNVIKWKYLPCYWPFVRGIQRSPVNSPHKGRWCGALMFPLICAWINVCANNREAGDLRRHRAHYDVTVMCKWVYSCLFVVVSESMWQQVAWELTGYFKIIFLSKMLCVYYQWATYNIAHSICFSIIMSFPSGAPFYELNRRWS